MSELNNSDITDSGEASPDANEEEARIVDSVDMRNDENKFKFEEEIPSSLTSEKERQNLNQNQVKYEDEDGDDYDEENPPEDLQNQWGVGDDGLDASELEVERFCQPKEALLIEDLTEHFRQRRVIVYPLRLSDLSHPIFIECIERSCSFQTNFTLCRRPLQDNEVSFVGLVDILFKSTIHARESVDGLKSIREEIVVKAFDMHDASAKKFITDWVKMNSTALCQIPTTLKNLIIIKNVPDELGYEQVRSSFPNASDVIIAHNKKKSVEKNKLVRTGFVFFDSENEVNEIDENYCKPNVPFIINGVKLRILPYQKPNLPEGLMKMKRRYRIMCQVRGLKAILKDLSVSKNFTDNQVNKINMVINNCRNLILTDNRIRANLDLPLHKFSDLKRIQSVRESITKDYNWLSTVSGFDCEAGTMGRNWKESSVGSNGGGGGKRWGADDASNRRFNDNRRSNRNRNRWNDNRRRLSPAYRDDYNSRDRRARGGSRLLEATSRVEEIAAKIARITNNLGLPRQPDTNPQLSSLGALMKNLTGYDALKAVFSANPPPPDQGDMGMMGPNWRGPKNDSSGPNAPANLNSFAGDVNVGLNVGFPEAIPPVNAPTKKQENVNANQRVGSSWQISSQTNSNNSSSGNSKWITKQNQPANVPNQPPVPTSTPFQNQQPPYQQHLDQQQQQYYGYNNYNYNNQYNYGAAGFPPNFGYPGFGGFPNNPPPPSSNKSGWAYNYPQWGNK